MKLPEVQDADKYTGLYVVDFGDHCGVGYVAEEVAELLGERGHVHPERAGEDRHPWLGPYRSES